MPNVRFKILTGPRTGESVEPDRDVFVLGGAAHADLCLIADEVSPEHCRIVVGPEHTRVEDLESEHGTRIRRAGKLLEIVGAGTNLSNGDVLCLGGAQALELLVELVADEEPANVVSVRPIGLLTTHTSSSERNAELLHALARVHASLGASKDAQDTLSIIADAALTLVPRATHATLILRDAQDDSRDGREHGYVPVLTRVRTTDGRVEAPSESVPVTRSVFRKVVRERAAVLATDAPSEAFSSESLLGANIKSTIGVPLWNNDDILGVLQVDNRDRPALFDGFDLEVLGILTTNASLALDNARLIERLTIAERKLSHENAYLKSRDRTQELSRAIVGESPALAELMTQLKKVADTRVTVLIQGETGTGKELVAAAVHAHSKRAKRLFVAQNCAAVPKDLLESELFGHRRGAFTGASEDKRGLFEVADGGTLFLDEVSELPLGLQAKLLRVLQEREIRPLGATRDKSVDVRIVAACNKDLEQEVQAGRFREDLYYRLNVFPLKLPALRERRSDIPLLARHFLKRYTREYANPVAGFSQETLDLLTRYDWPGNVRELENEIQRLVIQTDPNAFVSIDLLSERVRGKGSASTEAVPKGTLKQALEHFERELVLSALKDHANNKTQAAKSLGITREGLHKKLKQLGIG